MATGPAELTFVFSLEHGCAIDEASDKLYLVGDFNQWQTSVGQPEWEMKRTKMGGEEVLAWTGPAKAFFADPPVRFKFVTGEHIWLNPANNAPNVMRDDNGTANQFVDPNRTGNHYWRFTVSRPLALSQPWSIAPGGRNAHQACSRTILFRAQG